jgi:hypothetical protein
MKPRTAHARPKSKTKGSVQPRDLTPISSTSSMLIVEGEFNAARARTALEDIGLTFAVQGVAGANGQPDLSRVAGRQVFVYADGDAPGVKAAREWSAAALETGAASARVLQPLEGERDFCDLTHDALETWIQTAISDAVAIPLEDAQRDDGPTLERGQISGLPEIQVNARFVRDISSDAIRALTAANEPPTLFLRGEALTRVTPATVLKAEPLTAISLKSVLERVANFVKVEARAVNGENGKPLKDDAGRLVKENDSTPARVPNDVPHDILSQPVLPFPKLEALARSPIYAPSGALVMSNGFDSNTGFYLQLEGLRGLRCDLPLSEARALLLDDCLHDFPFADPRAGRAHAVALLLQPFVRNMIQGATPLFLIEAPTRGTGKGLLSDVVNIIAAGDVAGVMHLPRDGAELEKRITAALLDGARVLMLDNVTTLEGDALAAVLTARMWQGRVLGRSQMVRVPNDATWIATGNNVTLDDDMPRRIIPIRLDPQMERPETRAGFKHDDLRAWVREHRSELVSACLSIVEAWRAAGSPHGTERLGTYEAWCAVMGGILRVAGINGLLEGRDYLHTDSNQEPEEWGAVLKALYLEREKLFFSARDLLTVAKLQGALMDYWGGASDLGGLQRIGRAMTKNRDRVFAGYRLQAAGSDGHTKVNTYRVTRADNPNKTPQTPQNENQAVTDGLELAGFGFGNPAETPQSQSETPHGQPLEVRGLPETPQEPRRNPASLDAVQHEPCGVLRGLRGSFPVVATTESAPANLLSPEEQALETVRSRVALGPVQRTDFPSPELRIAFTRLVSTGELIQTGAKTYTLAARALEPQHSEATYELE